MNKVELNGKWNLVGLSPEGEKVELFADVPGMNREVLLMSGVPENHIDISDRCTISEPELFHSHRATGGRRGAMGNIIVISPTGEK